jgi:hypothetical protein
MMTTPTPVGVGRNESLTNLNEIVGQNENLLGPVISINDDGRPQTILTFDMNQNPPTKQTVIGPAEGGVPARSSTVCRGVVFINGQLTDAVAT